MASTRTSSTSKVTVKPAPKQSNPLRWSVEQVSEWATIEWKIRGEVIEAFKSQKIDGATLAYITAEALTQIGDKAGLTSNSWWEEEHQKLLAMVVAAQKMWVTKLMTKKRASMSESAAK